MRGSIRHRWVDDSVLFVRRHMVGATGNVYFGLHEFPDMAFVAHFLRADDLFFDIGANVGTYTVLASKVRGARCWSFEPDSSTVAHLRKNVEANGIGSLVEIKQVALGEIDGEIPFTIGLDTVNRVADSPTEPHQMVAASRLDTLCGATAPVMMKIDVEGHEPSVFRGAAKVIANPSLRAIEIETLDPYILDVLEADGFSEFFYDPFKRLLSSTPLEYHANNRLFIRDEAFVAQRLRQAPPVRVAGQSI